MIDDDGFGCDENKLSVMMVVIERESINFFFNFVIRII